MLVEPELHKIVPLKSVKKTKVLRRAYEVFYVLQGGILLKLNIFYYSPLHSSRHYITDRSKANCSPTPTNQRDVQILFSNYTLDIHTF